MKSSLNITSFIRLAIVVGLFLWASLIIKPFVGALAWAIILAVAIYPFYRKMVKKVGESKKKLFTTVFSIISIALVAIPSYMIFSSVLESTTTVLQELKEGTLSVSSPTEKVKDWPLGNKIYDNWESASNNLETYIINHKDFVMDAGKTFFGSFLGIMATLIVFILSLIIAIVFMYNADGAHKTSVQFAKKLVGENGEEIVLMARNTIRSVVKGILLVAIIQSVLSFIGFQAIGLPAAGFFTLLVLLCAIVQLPVTLAVIPAIALAFSTTDNTTYAVIFTVYILVVSLLDNFLKPVLLSKGLQTPTVIIFLGAIGGVMLHGIIGLFVGTVVMALAHRFYMNWVNAPNE